MYGGSLAWEWARWMQSRNDCCREAGGKGLHSWATKEKVCENTAGSQNVVCNGKIGENSSCPSPLKLILGAEWLLGEMSPAGWMGAAIPEGFDSAHHKQMLCSVDFPTCSKAKSLQS